MATAALTGDRGFRRSARAERPLLRARLGPASAATGWHASGSGSSRLRAAALFAPVIAPYDPNAIDLQPTGVLQPPSWPHPFGTDELGRDGFSRALFGARISLAVGFVAMAVAVTLGVLVGATAGMAGGWVDSFLMRSVDILLSVPLFFLIMISQIIFPPSIFTIMVIIGVASWMDVARLTRGEFLNLRAAEFVTSATRRRDGHRGGSPGATCCRTPAARSSSPRRCASPRRSSSNRR